VIEIRIDRKIPISIATVLILLVAFSSAAGVGSGPITTTTVQTINGLVFKITGAFTVAGTSYSPVVNNVAPTASCNWVTSPSCNTALGAGNWQFNVILNLNTVPTIATTYTIQYASTTGGVAASSIQFSVPTTAMIPSGQIFSFDTGLTTLPSTSVVTITVA
jgi:hypothetical protein